jgi:D-glycero-D-manno-heptose 1,7-bisphosphate phosphatase
VSLKGAVFLDRDGTVIEDTGYVRRAEDVRLITGAGEAIRRLKSAGFPVVIVTNQSGIARGLLTEADYRAVADRLEALLAEAGAAPDATYMCPHLPELTGPCPCRKPGLLHYHMAADALRLDLSRSVWIGDRLTDLLPALEVGGRGILVRTGGGMLAEPAAIAAGFAVTDDLSSAAAMILDGTGAQ